jgi:tetratricopeptide (TPR) repeat protein
LQASVPPQAEEFYRQAQYGEAIAILRQDNNLERSPRALALLARCLANQGEKAEALKWCRQAVLKDKLDAHAHYLLAAILIEQGEKEEALSSLRKALYLDPDFVMAHYMVGNLLLEEGQAQKAHRQFQQALGYLERYAPDQTLPEGSDLTAGRWLEIIAPLAVQEEPLCHPATPRKPFACEPKRYAKSRLRSSKKGNPCKRSLSVWPMSCMAWRPFMCGRWFPCAAWFLCPAPLLLSSA